MIVDFDEWIDNEVMKLAMRVREQIMWYYGEPANDNRHMH